MFVCLFICLFVCLFIPYFHTLDHQPQAKHHSMIDKLSPMKLMPWARNKEETLEEINRKTQRALEEALMKNIHLQEVSRVHQGSRQRVLERCNTTLMGPFFFHVVKTIIISIAIRV